MISPSLGTAAGLPASTTTTSTALVGGGHGAANITIAGASSTAIGDGSYGGIAVPGTAAQSAQVGALTIGSGAMPATTITPVVPPVLTPRADADVAATVTRSPTLVGPEGPGSIVPPAASSATSGGGGAAAAPQRLTSLAPGASTADADLVERTLDSLRGSPSGAAIVDRLLAVGAKVNVISDAEFQSMGHGDAVAFYDPKLDSMYVRRSDLESPDTGRAALALAHEGTHLLDDVGGLSAPIIQEITARVGAAGGISTAAGIDARDQGLFELRMMKEARAFLYAGQVARELGIEVPPSDPTSIAANGANDESTYARVWESLLQSSYNPDGRAAAIRNL